MRNWCAIIFNTSFNLGGEAIVETVYDAIDTCNRSMINHLYIQKTKMFIYLGNVLETKQNTYQTKYWYAVNRNYR